MQEDALFKCFCQEECFIFDLPWDGGIKYMQGESLGITKTSDPVSL